MSNETAEITAAMRIIDNIPLKWKINAVIIAVSTVVLLAGGFGTFLQYRSQFRETTVEELTSLAQVIAISVDTALVFDDRETARLVLRSLRAKPEVIAAGVYDAVGRLFATYGDMPAAGTVSVEDSRLPHYRFGARDLHLTVPIIVNREIVGSLTLVYSLAGVQERLRQFMFLLAVLTGVLLVVAFVLSNILQRVISTPLLELTKTATAITRDKNYALRVDARAGGEIGALIAGFNQMVGEVQKRDAYLEEQVSRRTGELQGAISDLRAEMAERRQVEADLRVSEERFRRMGENIREGLTILENWRVVYANDRACEIPGLSRQEYCATLPDQYVAQEERARVIDLLERIRKTGDCPEETELWIVRRDGARRCVHVRCAMSRTGQERVSCFLISRDVTEHRRMEEELLRARKIEATGVLAGGIAHDFNNLLSVVLGNLTLIQDRLGADRESQDYLESAEKAALRIVALIRRFVTFASGGAPVKRASVMQTLLRDAVDCALSGSNILAEYRLPEGLWQCNVDVDQVRQVVQVILDNAGEAMPGGGRVTVSARNFMVPDDCGEAEVPVQAGPYLRVCIADQGSGIPRGILPKVFDPYYSTKDRGHQKGMGLGLSIAYSIVEKHAGHLYLESRVGEGTQVYLLLPALLPGSAGEETLAKGEDLAVTRAERPCVFASGRVLIMDDEEMVRDIGGTILRKAGCEIAVAATGEEALETYAAALERKTPFDAVILDLTIKGGMGGVETMLRLQEIDPGVNAFVASGYSDDPVLSEYRDYGFRGAIPKPFSRQSLLAALSTVLRVMPAE